MLLPLLVPAYPVLFGDVRDELLFDVGAMACASLEQNG